MKATSSPNRMLDKNARRAKVFLELKDIKIKIKSLTDH